MVGVIGGSGVGPPFAGKAPGCYGGNGLKENPMAGSRRSSRELGLQDIVFNKIVNTGEYKAYNSRPDPSVVL
jgi:hypothetical protein